MKSFGIKYRDYIYLIPCTTLRAIFEQNLEHIVSNVIQNETKRNSTPVKWVSFETLLSQKPHSGNCGDGINVSLMWYVQLSLKMPVRGQTRTSQPRQNISNQTKAKL